MRSLLIILLLTSPLLAQEKLTNEQLVKADLFKTKVALAQCQAELADRNNQIASAQLTSEQKTNEEEFKKQLKCKDNEKFDWTTLTCTTLSDKK